jgi:hypothetical protein
MSTNIVAVRGLTMPVYHTAEPALVMKKQAHRVVGSMGLFDTDCGTLATSTNRLKSECRKTLTGIRPTDPSEYATAWLIGDFQNLLCGTLSYALSQTARIFLGSLRVMRIGS